MSIAYLNILTKQTGDKLSATEFNSTKNKINEIIDELNDVEPTITSIISQYAQDDEILTVTSTQYAQMTHSNDKMYVCVDNGEITSINVGDLSIVGADISPSLNSYVLTLIQQANNAADRAERANASMTYETITNTEIDNILGF